MLRRNMNILRLPDFVARHGRAAVLASSLALGAGAAQALDCGDYSFPFCKAQATQFAGGFKPPPGLSGGFGGGSKCKATRTPIVFVHGNGDSALGWDAPVAPLQPGKNRLPGRSVYDELVHRGYTPCELYGLSYLSPAEQDQPARNYHEPEKYQLISAFIRAVKAHTGAKQVDIVAHSLGVSMTMAALQVNDGWADVRRFINLAGGLRGLEACLLTGPANPLAPTCGSANVFNADVFGFHPQNNAWTGTGSARSLREMPRQHPAVRFYTVSAGMHDQVHCPSALPTEAQRCASGPLFSPAPNVRAQLDIGAGATMANEKQGGDADGVGHFKLRNHAGAIIHTMLTTDCRGLNCKGRYDDPVKVAREVE